MRYPYGHSQMHSLCFLTRPNMTVFRGKLSDLLQPLATKCHKFHNKNLGKKPRDGCSTQTPTRENPSHMTHQQLLGSLILSDSKGCSYQSGVGNRGRVYRVLYISRPTTNYY